MVSPCGAQSALRRALQGGYTVRVARVLKLLLAFLAAAAGPSSAAVVAPVVALPAAVSFAPASAVAPASLGSLAPPAMPMPGLGAALPPAALAAAPAAAAAPAVAAPAVAATENSLIRTPDVDAGLAALRAASYEQHPQTTDIVARIKAAHPDLPISAENLFLVRDAALLRSLGIPEDAAGAARIVTDGRREVPVVILVAGRGVALDRFVEFAVHEAVHLMDDGILRVRHDQDLKHFFAEGWTQKRAVTMANRVLSDLGRPATAGNAYHQEIALISAFSALHGEAALDELVRTGSDDGLRRALGPRWDLATRLISAPASRERRLNALIALINADSIGPTDEAALLDYLR